MALKADVSEIQSAVTEEIFFALGLNRRGFLRRGLGWVFTRPTQVFAHFMAAVDEAVGIAGPPAGCQKMLDQLGVKIQTIGQEHLPVEGPAIVLANHPGAYDSMAIGSLIPRPDLKAIVSNTRLYRVLPNIYPSLFPVGEGDSENMLAIRKAVAHLRQGGILLQFGSGLIEPDPATHLVSDLVFEKWSPSLEILIRKVPEAKVIPTIASGVLLDRFLEHTLVKLRRGAMDKRRLAEFLQVIQQLVRPQSVQSTPRISFGSPFTLDQILSESDDRRIMPKVIQRMKQHLAKHLAWVSKSKNFLAK